MPRALQRKLTDVTSGEDLAAIKELLEAQKIPILFQIWNGKDVDFYRIYVYIAHLERAKELLRKQRTAQ